MLLSGVWGAGQIADLQGRDLHVETSVEYVEVEVVDFQMNGCGPFQHVIGEIFRRHEKDRGNERQQMQLARFAIRPDGLNAHDQQTR